MNDRSSKPTGKVGNRSTLRGKGPRDPNELAFSIVQQATGQAPKQEPPPVKNTAAVTLVTRGSSRNALETPQLNRWNEQDSSKLR